MQCRYRLDLLPDLNGSQLAFEVEALAGVEESGDLVLRYPERMLSGVWQAGGLEEGYGRCEDMPWAVVDLDIWWDDVDVLLHCEFNVGKAWVLESGCGKGLAWLVWLGNSRAGDTQRRLLHTLI